MGHRFSTRVTSVISKLALTALLVTCSASGVEAPDYDTQQPAVSAKLMGVDVVLEARLRHWTDESLVVDYILHNKSNTDLIVLTGKSESLQSALLPDGTVRLFQGKQDIDDADFYKPPTVVGQSLITATSLNGSGSSWLPLQLEFPENTVDTIGPAMDDFEFCIGYGLADELEPTSLEENKYPFNKDLQLQRFACTNLARNSKPSTAHVSSLDEVQPLMLSKLLSYIPIFPDEASISCIGNCAQVHIFN